MDEFDITKLRYDRIICTTDDVDGSHIRTLLAFSIGLENLCENGMSISPDPALQGHKRQKGKYCYSDEELKAIQEEYGKVELQRYKGLGEMNAEQLYETTMNPEKRALIRVKMEDAEDAEEIFTLLMGEQPELRRQFIEENATLVKELDI